MKVSPAFEPATPQSVADALWMLRAVAAGREGELQAVRPNPRVGCVLVHDGELVGVGFHAQCGGPHAEVNALAQAGDRAHGATAYVTLEPCNHHGRTPPCTAALLKAGVSRVVIGVRDPHGVAAGGAEALSQAGVAVAMGVAAQECADLAEVFLTCERLRRPFVQWKVAVTLDGRVAATDGTTRWISGPASRLRVQRLRAQADAVLVGGETALTDNPRLNLRDLPPCERAHPPLRVVLDRRMRLPLDHHLANIEDQATLVITDSAESLASPRALALASQGVQLLAVPPADAWLRAVLAELWGRGVRHVLCEAGPRLGTALLAADLVDRLDLVMAPKLLGSGSNWLESLGIDTIAKAQPWRLDTPEVVGGDVWLSARRAEEMEG